MRRTEQYSEKLSRLYPELHEPVGTEKILTQTVTSGMQVLLPDT